MHHDPPHIIAVIVLTRSTAPAKRYGRRNMCYFETLWSVVYTKYAAQAYKEDQEIVIRVSLVAARSLYVAMTDRFQSQVSTLTVDRWTVAFHT